MNGDPGSSFAIWHIRVLLIKAGLEEEEADEFLDRLGKEIRAGSLETLQARVQFIENQIAHIGRRGRHSRLETVKDIILGVLLGVAGNAAWEALKSAFGTMLGPISAVSKPWPKDWPIDLMIEWAGAAVWKDAAAAEPVLRLALEHRTKLYGLLDQRTAVSLDGLAMCLDDQERHREAVKLRLNVLDIEKRLHGSGHQGTAVALSNLGVCLQKRNRYTEADKYLQKSLKILKVVSGINHPLTAAVVWNLYVGLKARGRLSGVTLPFSVPENERATREAANQMMARKRIFVTLDAAHEGIEAIKPMVGLD